MWLQWQRLNWCGSNQHTIVLPDKFYEKSPNFVSVAVFVAKIRFFEINAGTLCPLLPLCKIELNWLRCHNNQTKTSLKKYSKFETLCDMFLIYFKPSLITKCKFELGILQKSIMKSNITWYWWRHLITWFKQESCSVDTAITDKNKVEELRFLKIYDSLCPPEW